MTIGTNAYPDSNPNNVTTLTNLNTTKIHDINTKTNLSQSLTNANHIFVTVTLGKAAILEIYRSGKCEVWNTEYPVNAKKINFSTEIYEKNCLSINFVLFFIGDNTFLKFLF